MNSTTNFGRVLRIKLAGRAEKRDVLRRIISSSDSITLAYIDPDGVLTAFVGGDEGEFTLASSVFAAGMYPLATEELALVPEGTTHAS